ncbi:BACON domain-containing protein [Klebsiella pneumoniae]|uniref:BACON domain-containing protein n=3 Tax=Bacteria TaxID=2 RepID=UPI000D1B671C|nr:BACON domain-containing carbohydrate-binding protein [Klebsiella pneumoniae]
MAEIATWSAILNKTGLGKTSNECPTKAELLALNNGKDSNVDKVIVISNAASYGNNECVKLEDINAEQWIYTFQWDPNGNPSFNAPATGGTYPFGSYASNRVKQVNGVNTTISQSLANDVTKTSEGSWYTTDYDGNKGRIVPNNTSTNSKSITVTWTQKYSGKTIQATFTQAAGRKVYSSWSYNCRVDKTSFSYSGGQSNVTAKSASRTYTWNGQGSSYTESETATVRVSSPASISGNSISIPSNSGSARNFTVTFDFPTATDQTISISQEGGQVTYVDHLSIDPTTKNVSGSGQTFDVIVNANYDMYLNGVWQENIKSQYTKATVVSGSSSDIIITRTSTGCSIKVAPNPNESSSRTYVVEFTYDLATPVRLTITQNETVVSYPSDGYYLGQSRSSSGFTTSDLNVTNGDRDGGSFTVYYKSYRTKYVNGSQAGLEPVTPNIAPGDFWLNTFIDPRPHSDNVYTVEVRYQANNRNTERSTRITGSNGGATTVYTNFSQEARLDYFFTFDSNEGPTEKSFSTDAAAKDFPFVNIYSRDSVGRAISFSISGVVPSWITCEIHENGVSVPAEIRVRLDENPIHVNRSATITLVQSNSGKTLTIKVSQANRLYNLELLGSGVVYLWEDGGIKPNSAISPTTKFTTNCPTILKHLGSLIVNNSALGGLGVQVGNGDRVNIYKHDGTWRFVTSFILIQDDQVISW